MGMLIDGVWTDEDNRRVAADGSFVRAESAFRDHVSADGSSGYKAEAGRYHLYVARSCPWAHRTFLYRALKGLDDAISITFAGPQEQGRGWEMTGRTGAYADPLLGATFMYEVYQQQTGTSRYTGRVTVPVLWDKQTSRIVNNESPEIIRMLNREFNAFAKRDLHDLYPAALRAQIDEWNALIYPGLNNGVYRAGFATVQEKYEEAVHAVFATLDKMEAQLAQTRYLCGERTTEADWRAFPTLIRFDVVYHGHFKCNLRRLVDYPNLWAYTRDLYQQPGVAATVNLDDYRRNYYRNQRNVNPSRVVAIGPQLDLAAPHHRG